MSLQRQKVFKGFNCLLGKKWSRRRRRKKNIAIDYKNDISNVVIKTKTVSYNSAVCVCIY